jgi:hypothetical protein
MTVDGRLRSEGLPKGIASAVLRRVVRGRGPMFRRLHTASPAPWVSRVYQAPVAPPPPSVPGRLTVTQLQEPLTRLEELTGGKSTFVSATAADSAKKLLLALTAQRDYLRVTESLAGVPIRPTRSLSQVNQALDEQRTALLQATDPKITVTRRVKARIQTAAPGLKTAPEPGQDLAPLVMPAPQFFRPMYEVLREFSQDLLLPGLEHVPPETVTMLQTNPRFVEAFMTGLNHEMGRELLWRGYPTDQRGTCFTRFWDTSGSETDQMQLPPIHTWPLSQRLGSNFVGKGGDDGRLVLLIRGELLRRYSGAVIYAAPAASPIALDAKEKRMPIFRGTLEPDVIFLGFNLTTTEARGEPGWFFVIEQQPTEPRFGLDVPETFGLNPTDLDTWANLSWGYIVSNQDAFEAMSHLSSNGPLAGKTLGDIGWGFNSAHMAAITLQPPARIAIHAAALIPE